MVSFWPFKGDYSSAASFEKVLSQLSTKINKASVQNDGLRQHQRRYKALWTLYSIFAYILVTAILTLVTGYQTWSYPEYTAVAGSPVLIFGVRTALDAYYNYRVANSQAHLNELYKQREQAIQKLKAATKYDSTQQLLDKYGGTPKKRGSSPQPPKKRKSEGQQGRQSLPPQGPRTGFAPPPTANIQRPPSADAPPPGAPGQSQRNVSGSAPDTAGTLRPQSESNEEFAPNAFSAPQRPPAVPQQAFTQYAEGPKWYDRILDVVLGEDETQAKNRMALVCQHCRLVNGQAPPGARTLEDVGRWRCSSCHAWNGVESEHKEMIKKITGQGSEAGSPVSANVPTSAVSESAPRPDRFSDEDSGDYEHVEEDLEDDDADSGAPVDTPPAASTRSKARQKRKA